MTKSPLTFVTSMPHPGMLPSEAHLQHFQMCTLFTQFKFFEDIAGSLTRLSHILNFPGAFLTDGMFLMAIAE